MVRTIGEDSGERKVIDDISTYGWHCVHIAADEHGPAYSFTIGLAHSYGYSELIVFGLPRDVSHQILSIAADAAKAGKPIDLSKPTDAFLEGYECCFAEVPTSQYRDHVGFCRWYYLGNNFPLHQIIWPSRSGHFPWHPEASAEFKAAQPVISHAPLGA